MTSLPGLGASSSARDGSEPLRVLQWVRIRWWNACAYYAVSLAEALSRRGHRSFLLAPEGTPSHAEAKKRGLLQPNIGDIGTNQPWALAQNVDRLRKFLEREQIELVNVHSGPGHLALSVVCRRLGIPLVRTRGDIRPPRIHPLSKWLYTKGTTHHLVSADFLRAGYGPLGVPSERITTLHGGTDLRPVRAIDRAAARQRLVSELGVKRESLLVGMIARLSPVKGHDHLLAAVARLREAAADPDLSESERYRFPPIELVFIGPDAQRTKADLRAAAGKAGLAEQTHLLGKVNDPLEYAAGLDVAVIASTDSEAICRSAFEYLAVGTPIVASDLNAIGEVLSSDTAVLFPPGDSEALAAALGRVARSRDLRLLLSARGQEKARAEYSLETFGERAASLFSSLARPTSLP